MKQSKENPNLDEAINKAFEALSYEFEAIEQTIEDDLRNLAHEKKKK